MIVGILEYAKENSKDETLKALKNVIDEWINNCDRIDVNLYAKRMYNIGVYFFVLFTNGLVTKAEMEENRDNLQMEMGARMVEIEDGASAKEEYIRRFKEQKRNSINNEPI